MSKKPYASDWQATDNPDTTYSPSQNLYWNSKEREYRDQLAAEHVGWIGIGYRLKRAIGETNGI